MHRTAFVRGIALTVLSGFAAAALQAQAPADARPWTLSAGALTYRVSDVNGWGVGPAAGAQRRVHKAVRFDLNLGVLLSSSGFYDFSGLALDAGPSLVRLGHPLELGLGIGLSSIVGSDSDGTGGGWVGGYLAGQATAWLSPRVGFTVRAAIRQMSTARTSPSFSAALAIHP